LVAVVVVVVVLTLLVWPVVLAPLVAVMVALETLA
jgi:hypothetical protein